MAFWMWATAWSWSQLADKSLISLRDRVHDVEVDGVIGSVKIAFADIDRRLRGDEQRIRYIDEQLTTVVLNRSPPDVGWLRACRVEFLARTRPGRETRHHLTENVFGGYPDHGPDVGRVALS